MDWKQQEKSNFTNKGNILACRSSTCHILYFLVTLCGYMPYSTWDAFLKYAFLPLFGSTSNNKLACYDQFLHAMVQTRDTSLRDDQYKEQIVQGTQYSRIFVRGHIGRGCIVPASVHGVTQVSASSCVVITIHRHVVQCWDASSKGRIVKGTHRPRDASSKGRIVQGTHRPRDASSKGRIVQGTNRNKSPRLSI